MTPRKRKATVKKRHPNEHEHDVNPIADISDGSVHADDYYGRQSRDVKIDFKVPYGEKEIHCERRGGNLTLSETPSLIFTHGAGGGFDSPATRDFSTGLAEVAPIVCFQGTMNLQSRVKAFHAIIEHLHSDSVAALGGRSLGARAAVVTAQGREVEALVLVSYPLIGVKKGDVRDQILLDLPESVDVLFMIGGADKMCDREQLMGVIEKMKPKCWYVEVHGADHGMSIRQKEGVQAIGRKTGAVAAEWLRSRGEDKRFCSIKWDDENGKAVSSVWANGPEDADAVDVSTGAGTPAAKKKQKIK